MTQGFHNAVQDLKPTRTYIVAQVESRYAFAENIEVILLVEVGTVLRMTGYYGCLHLI